MDIAIQIPGRWSSVPSISGVVVELLPRDPGLGEEYVRLGRERLAPRDLEAVGAHTGIVRARVEGGSTAAARTLLGAGAFLLDIAGTAVKVETSEAVRSRDEWLELAQRRTDSRLYYAFVEIDTSDRTAASRGMHAFGLRDAVITRAPGDAVAPGDRLRGFLLYHLVRQPNLRSGDLYCETPGHKPVYRLSAAPAENGNPHGLWLLNEAGPVPVAGLTDVVAVSAGGHGLALGADGIVWVWGVSHARSPGRPSSFDRPVPVEDLTGEAAAIAAGGRHSLVLLADGSVMSFGDNSYGQLGDGTTVASARPVRVDLSGVVAIAAGSDHSVALLGDGTLAAWGGNMAGQLGDGTQVGRSRPAPMSTLDAPAATIAAGACLTVAVLHDGSVAQSGYRGVDGRRPDASQVGFHKIDLGEPVATVDAAGHILVVLRGGAVAAWGANFLGQLGDRTRDARTTPMTVSGLADRAVAVAAGSGHSLALLESGAVLSWGHPFEEPTPLPVRDVVAISAGTSLSLALERGGGVLAWGSDLGGQLGAGGCHVGPSPGDIPPAPITPATRESLEALARRSARLYGVPGEEVRPGGTKLGGRPDLPAAIPWPTLDGVPQAFVAQVDVAEVVDALGRPDTDAEGPSGLLAFFCDSAFGITGPGSDELGCTVLPVDARAPLVRRDFPDGLPEEWRFPELALRAHAEVMDVPVDAWELGQVGLAYDQIRAWGERAGEPEQPRHRVFGYPEPVQGEPRQWSDEVLLLQVDADDGAGMEWADDGRVFYFVRRADLAGSRFDRVRLVYQCH